MSNSEDRHYLGIVHVPQKAIGLGIQDEISSQELPTGLIVLNVQEPTDSVLTIHIRHSGLLLASPCEAQIHRDVNQAFCKHRCPVQCPTTLPYSCYRDLYIS